MDTKYVMGWAIMIAFVAYCSYRIGKAIWSCFDHSNVENNAILSRDAKIVNVHSEKVQYVKNGMKYKTTVYFSDGFEFITHDTDREDELLSYRISISPELYKAIIENAKEAHDRALAKQQLSPKSIR